MRHFQPVYRSRPSPVLGASRSHSFRHTTLGGSTLDEWSARRRDLYMTTYNTHKRHTSKPLAGFEPTIPASAAADRAATGIGVTATLQDTTLSAVSAPGTVAVLLAVTKQELTPLNKRRKVSVTMRRVRRHASHLTNALRITHWKFCKFASRWDATADSCQIK
jgi:hypothetical protein